MTARPVPKRHWRAGRAAVFLVLAFAGCTDLHTDLQDDHGRWVESCRATGFGLATGLIAHSVYTDCMDRARAAGLKPIN
jgi:hypothetical protein